MAFMINVDGVRKAVLQIIETDWRHDDYCIFFHHATKTINTATQADFTAEVEKLSKKNIKQFHTEFYKIDDSRRLRLEFYQPPTNKQLRKLVNEGQICIDPIGYSLVKAKGHAYVYGILEPTRK